MRRGLFAGVAAVVACVAIGLVAQHYIAPFLKERARKAALMQLGKALRMYSDESKGGLFPPKCREKNVFLPDMDMLANGLAKVWPEFRQDPQIKALLAARDERPLCYLGHVLAYEAAVDNLFEKYEEEEPDEVRNFDPSTSHGRTSSEIWRLKQGVERFLMWDINGPGSSSGWQSMVPILWEVPRNGEDRFAVLFEDGHMERLKYPASSPCDEPDPIWMLSTHSINKVRRALSLPLNPESPIVPPEGPVAEAVLAALRVSEHPESPERRLCLKSCDETPSVHIKGCTGYRVGLGGYSLILFPDNADVSTVSAEELYPASEMYKRYPSLQSLKLRLGSGMGFQWYGNVSYKLLKALRRELGLTGGEDAYPVAAKALSYRTTIPYPEDKYKKLQPAQRIEALKSVLEKPRDVKSYTDAYILLREAEGNPVAGELMDACGVLHDCPGCQRCIPNPKELEEEACRRLVSAADTEAAAVAAAAILATWQGQHPPKVLEGCPKDEVLSMLELAARSPSERQRTYASDVLRALGK